MVSRAEQRQTTLLRLGDAAVELFETLGPKATIDEIAERAGMSRRTVFRWCDAKEELAFVHPTLWRDVFASALAEPNRGTSASQRLIQASLAIARHVDADPEPPRRAFIVAAMNPELLRGFHTVFYQWVDIITNEAERAGLNPFEARVVGSAVMGMVDATTREWVVGGPGVSFESVLARGIVQLKPLLDRLDQPETLG